MKVDSVSFCEADPIRSFGQRSMSRIRFQMGSHMLTSLGSDITEQLISCSERSGKGRVFRRHDGGIGLTDSLWSDYGDSHTDLHAINDLIRIKDRIATVYKNTLGLDKSFVIIDWGCGAGHTLMQLEGWLQDENIQGIKLYGFANEIHPEWQYAPENITFILDVADQLPFYFKPRSVDFIYSIAGLYYLFLPELDGPDCDMVEYFSRHAFYGGRFRSYSHTEKYLERLSFIMKFHGELLIDLPIHIIDIDFNLLSNENKNYDTQRNPELFGEHAYVLSPRR